MKYILLLFIVPSIILACIINQAWFIVYVLVMAEIGLLFCYNEKTPYGNCESQVFLVCYCIYFLFTCYVISFINNPEEDCFINTDSNYIYMICNDYQNTRFRDAIDDFTTQFEYHEMILCFCLRYFLHMTGRLLHLSNLYLFSALSNVLVGAMIPVVILKILRIKKMLNKDTIRYTFMYAFFSPIMIALPELTRDLHVALIYSLLMYFFLVEKMRFRYVYMVILVVCAYYFRIENGLYAIIFIFLRVFMTARHFQWGKYILFPAIACSVLLFVEVYSVDAMSVIRGYSNRSLEEYDGTGSLAIRLFYSLPFPLDVCAKTVFGQMLPFPVTVTLKQAFVAPYATVVSWFTPFFLIPIQSYSIIKIIKNGKDAFKKDFSITILYLVSCIYIILVSAGQSGHRRAMAVYPAIFMFFLFCNNMDESKLFRKCVNISTVTLVFFHIVYFIIK